MILLTSLLFPSKETKRLNKIKQLTFPNDSRSFLTTFFCVNPFSRTSKTKFFFSLLKILKSLFFNVCFFFYIWKYPKEEKLRSSLFVSHFCRRLMTFFSWRCVRRQGVYLLYCKWIVPFFYILDSPNLVLPVCLQRWVVLGMSLWFKLFRDVYFSWKYSWFLSPLVLSSVKIEV